MIKALLVVMTVTGSEYNINMPDMKTCMEQARVVISQDTATKTLCIPRADKSAKVKEIFSLFGNNEFKFECSIGKQGLTKNKKEGDRKTPIGTFSLGNLYHEML